MRSVECLVAGLDALAGEEVAGLPDAVVRADLVALLVAVNRLSAEVARRVAVFDARGLAEGDGCRSTAAWLRGFGRLSGPAAGAQVKRVRVLRALPELAAGPALVAVGSVDVPQRLRCVCARVLVHVDPDGGQPDAQVDFARRALTLSPCDGMVLVRGQLDPEGGAALATALDALMRPPGCGDARSATQRRADALVELARGALREGRTPTVAGMRPQVAVLLTPPTLTGRPGRPPSFVDRRGDPTRAARLVDR